MDEVPKQQEFVGHLALSGQPCMQCYAADNCRSKHVSYLQQTITKHKTSCCEPHMKWGSLWLLEPERIHKASVYIVADQQS